MGQCVLGLNNAWAVKRFTEPEVWVEIAATKMGVSFIQFSFDLLDPKVDEEILNDIVPRTIDSCRKYGVKIQSCFTGVVAYSNNLLLHPSLPMRQYAFDWYSRATSLSGKLGAEMMGGHMGALTVKDFNDAQRRESLLSELVEHLISLSRISKDAGLQTLLWEPMPVSREPPSTILEARTLLDRVNRSSSIPVKLCIDVGHACNPNARDPRDRDPYAWLNELGSDSPCVHLQQTDGKGDRHWPFTEEYNRIGVIDGKKIISSLDKSGASKTYLYLEAIPAFEQDDSQVIEDMVKSVKYWKAYV